MFRHDTFTGGEHYWIQFEKGTHVIKREVSELEEENEIIFIGFYENCLKELERIKEENADYDLNL
jgi:hypothetical protein